MYLTAPGYDRSKPHRGRRWARENYQKSSLITTGTEPSEGSLGGGADLSCAEKTRMWMQYQMKLIAAHKKAG